MRWFYVLACVVVAGVSTPSEARIKQSDGTVLGEYCRGLQDSSDRLRIERAQQGVPWNRLLGIAIELQEIGRLWDELCKSEWGSITRDSLVPGVSTFQDSDMDGVFDEDEVVFGLDMRSPDTDRDGLADGSDPSWLADLIAAAPDATFADPWMQRGLLVDDAFTAEAEVLTGDRAAAAMRLVDAQATLGGCAPDPRTLVVSDVCQAAQVLSVELGAR